MNHVKLARCPSCNVAFQYQTVKVLVRAKVYQCRRCGKIAEIGQNVEPTDTKGLPAIDDVEISRTL